MSSIKEIYLIFRKNSWKVGSYTPEKDNNLFYDFWCMCISGGFDFDIDVLKDDDIKKLPQERHYNLAVYENNISFCKAYENLKGRKPFICKKVDYVYRPSGAVTVHQTQEKKQGRLVIGAKFIWEDLLVTVTSFKDFKHCLVACSYKPDTDIDNNYTRAKIQRRFSITHQDFMKNRKKQQLINNK